MRSASYFLLRYLFDRLGGLAYESDGLPRDMNVSLNGFSQALATYREVIQGQAEVRRLFKVPKVGVVAGCYVTDGKVTRNSEVRLLRDSVVIFTGKVGSLKRFKDDVSEVKQGYECGIGIANYNDVKLGDVIEFFVREEIAAESL